MHIAAERMGIRKQPFVDFYRIYETFPLRNKADGVSNVGLVTEIGNLQWINAPTGRGYNIAQRHASYAYCATASAACGALLDTTKTSGTIIGEFVLRAFGTDGGKVGLIFRASAGLDFIMLVASQTSAGLNYVIEEYDLTGTLSSSIDTGVPVGTDKITLQVDWDDTSFTCYANGTSIYSTASTFLNNNTKIGFMLQNGATAVPICTYIGNVALTKINDTFTRQIITTQTSLGIGEDGRPWTMNYSNAAYWSDNTKCNDLYPEVAGMIATTGVNGRTTPLSTAYYNRLRKTLGPPVGTLYEVTINNYRYSSGGGDSLYIYNSDNSYFQYGWDSSSIGFHAFDLMNPGGGSVRQRIFNKSGYGFRPNGTFVMSYDTATNIASLYLNSTFMGSAVITTPVVPIAIEYHNGGANTTNGGLSSWLDYVLQS